MANSLVEKGELVEKLIGFLLAASVLLGYAGMLA